MLIDRAADDDIDRLYAARSSDFANVCLQQRHPLGARTKSLLLHEKIFLLRPKHATIVILVGRGILVTEHDVRGALLQDPEPDIEPPAIAEDHHAFSMKGTSVFGKYVDIALDGRERVIRLQAGLDNDAPQKQGPHQFFRHEMTDQARDQIRQVQGWGSRYCSQPSGFDLGTSNSTLTSVER